MRWLRMSCYDCGKIAVIPQPSEADVERLKGLQRVAAEDIPPAVAFSMAHAGHRWSFEPLPGLETSDEPAS